MFSFSIHLVNICRDIDGCTKWTWKEDVTTCYPKTSYKSGSNIRYLIEALTGGRGVPGSRGLTGNFGGSNGGSNGVPGSRGLTGILGGSIGLHSIDSSDFDGPPGSVSISGSRYCSFEFCLDEDDDYNEYDNIPICVRAQGGLTGIQNVKSWQKCGE